MYEIAAHIKTGNVRTKNDDRISICGNVLDSGSMCIKSKNVIAAVIDGVGGEKYGDVAAQAAADTISLEYRNSFESTVLYASDLITSAHNSVLKVRTMDIEHSHASAAIAGILIKSDNITSFNWGDSKVFVYRDSNIIQKSKDNNLLQQMIDIGIPCPDFDNKTPLTCYLGCARNTSDEPNILYGHIERDDIWIVCSDGLSDYLAIDELKDIMELDCSLSDKFITMVEKALANQSDDNISVILVKGE